MEPEAYYYNYERTSEIDKKDIEKLTDEEFRIFALAIIQDNDQEKQKSFVQFLTSERFWENKTSIFIKFLSLQQGPLCHIAEGHLYDYYYKGKSNDIKRIAPGLYAIFYYWQQGKLPPAKVISNKEFFFGQLLVSSDKNSNFVEKLASDTKLKNILKKNLEVKDDESHMDNKARKLWSDRYRHLLIDKDTKDKAEENLEQDSDFGEIRIVTGSEEVVDEFEYSRFENEEQGSDKSDQLESALVENSIESTVKRTEEFSEEYQSSSIEEDTTQDTSAEEHKEKLLSENDEYPIEISNKPESVYPIEVNFLVSDESTRLEIIEKLINSNESLADLLLSLWIRMVNESEFSKLNEKIIYFIHQAFGAESQRAMIFKGTTLLAQSTLAPEEFGQLLSRFNLLDKFFNLYSDLNINPDQYEIVMKSLVEAGEGERVVEGLLNVSRSSNENATVASNLLINLMIYSKQLRRILDQKTRSMGKLVSALITKVSDLAAVNDDLLANVEYKEKQQKYQKIDTIQEVGEALKKILRSMETKAAELIIGGQNEDYFINFLFQLRKQLDLIGLQPIENYSLLGKSIDPRQGIHIRDGSGDGDLILKTLGIQTRNINNEEVILDHPRVEVTTRYEEGETNA